MSFAKQRPQRKAGDERNGAWQEHFRGNLRKYYNKPITPPLLGALRRTVSARRPTQTLRREATAWRMKLPEKPLLAPNVVPFDTERPLDSFNRGLFAR